MRSFIDGTGTEWIVWAVHPQRESARHVERRQLPDRRVSAAPEPVIERRAQAERRHSLEGASRSLRMHYPEGWLTFQAGTVRRRLSPIPSGWESRSEAELQALLDVAQPARAATRAVGGQAADTRRTS